MRHVVLLFIAACASGPTSTPHDASDARRAAQLIRGSLPRAENVDFIARSFASVATYDGFTFLDTTCAARFGDHGTIDKSNRREFASCIFRLPARESISWVPAAEGDPLVAPTTPPTIQVWAGPGDVANYPRILRLAMRGVPVAPPAVVEDTGAPEEEVERPASEVLARLHHGSTVVPGDASKRATLHVCFVREKAVTATVRTTSGSPDWDAAAIARARELEIEPYKASGGAQLDCADLVFTANASAREDSGEPGLEGGPEDEIPRPADEIRGRIRRGSLAVAGDARKHATLHVCFSGNRVARSSVQMSSGDPAWDRVALAQAKTLEIKPYEERGATLMCADLVFTGKAP